MNFSSKLLEQAVAEFSSLPGIGQKTALRLVLNLLNREKQEVEKFINSLIDLKSNVKFCNQCHNLSDDFICEICQSNNRQSQIVCIVEDTRDVMAIENTRQFFGIYHVLGGLISPMDGVGPSDLNIESLINRVKTGNIEEVIFAISATMEGDTTLFYLNKKLKDFPIKVSTIARGISFGGEIEYADELTLGRSITTRIPYDNAFK